MKENKTNEDVTRKKDLEEIEKWTLWKITNCYKARVNIKTYDDSLKICLVSGDGKSISDKNHWHSRLMVRD